MKFQDVNAQHIEITQEKLASSGISYPFSTPITGRDATESSDLMEKIQ